MSKKKAKPARAKPAHKPAKVEKKKQKEGWFSKHFAEH
jgi:hypothetical protein